jgi:hypothetical protein
MPRKKREPIRYNIDPINEAIGRLRLTNEKVAQKVTEARRRPMAARTVASIRNGDPNVKLPNLAIVLDVLGVQLYEVFAPIEEKAA